MPDGKGTFVGGIMTFLNPIFIHSETLLSIDETGLISPVKDTSPINAVDSNSSLFKYDDVIAIHIAKSDALSSILSPLTTFKYTS